MTDWFWSFAEPTEFYCSRPTHLPDQRFALDLLPQDFIAPREHRNSVRCPAGYLRPWKSAAAKEDVGSTVEVDKDKFQINLDVQQFKPHEITVKLAGENAITVEGKHEEKQDEHGYISRHFVRKYVLPKGLDTGNIHSKLSTDGVLTVIAPKLGAGGQQNRCIPIIQTGEPAKKVKNEEKN